eukprot:6213032-Pleurochrysis_carterae.AAC.2
MLQETNICLLRIGTHSYTPWLPSAVASGALLFDVSRVSFNLPRAHFGSPWNCSACATVKRTDLLNARYCQAHVSVERVGRARDCAPHTSQLPEAVRAHVALEQRLRRDAQPEGARMRTRTLATQCTQRTQRNATHAHECARAHARTHARTHARRCRQARAQIHTRTRVTPSRTCMPAL